MAEPPGWPTSWLTVGLALGFALPFVVFFLRRKWVSERKKALRGAAE